ncbi:TonB-dependent receptor [Pseudoduganella sp. FT25W]|uniref:TonB-dependent receptor n=1 Tax=Duganella alba TaxID=2666081 RepID=A0A6L5QN16_9BURK|nr:TonB-dependent receptor [Duganella alba]MRX11057.1 TonB-dependent receptor [Duganella alba]MRX15274.1 TonB-dependent receptor [Duganella alba]
MTKRFITHVATALLAANAAAQTPDQDTTEPIQRVEITGSLIRRIASETSLPLTSIRAEDFARQGLTTAQQVLNSIPMNQTSVSSAQSVGLGTGGQSQADLRGLGGQRTLVLLNGRRIASHPILGDSVDLNVIPLSALDRVEVLRDGASAVYGSDAIGGVINFITKRQVTGGEVTVEAYQPQEEGGGSERRLNLSGGFGDLATDRFNVFGVIDVHRQLALPATARPFSATGVIPSRGVSQTSGTPFPANFFSDNGISGNPAFASGCLPPASIPNTSGSPTCRYDYTREVDDIPYTKQESYLGRASYKLGQDHTLALELLHARSTNTARVAPPPLAGIGLIMHGDSPYYPGGSAGVPAVDGLTGEDLDVSWRPLVTGRRTDYSTSTADRLVLSAEGTLAGWDYSAGLNHSISQAASAFAGGYVIDQRMIDGVGSGLLNPFGDQSAAGLAYLQDSLLIGEYLRARMRATALDVRASRDVYQLSGGALGFALGAEARKERALYSINRALASQASSSGYADAQDQSGDRRIYALFAELNAPLIKNLELNGAARFDHYSDVGRSFTPKISARYQPVTPLLLRASWNRGFRAPTLFDLHGPQTVTNSSDPWNDPVLCPGGVPVAGANPNLACDQQQNIRQGGNPNVRPERSKTYSAGVVFEPVRDLSLSLDYWNIRLRDQINALAEQTVFNDYAKYQSLFHYNAAGTRLDDVSLITDNLGEVKTSGIDTSLLWRLPKGRYGTLALQIDGTWVRNYDYQNERGGAFTENVGRYADASPVFRWRHNATLTWQQGAWGASLTNRYMSGYTDQNAVDPEFFNQVKSYSTWSLSGNYSGIRHVDLTLGVRNLFDEDPPFTNQSTTFQQGYDPRYTDPLGRTWYARLTYKF